MNLYQQSGLSNLISLQLEMGVAFLFSMTRISIIWATSREKVSSSIYRQQRPSSDCTSTQSNQDLQYLFTESLDTSLMKCAGLSVFACLSSSMIPVQLSWPIWCHIHFQISTHGEQHACFLLHVLCNEIMESN